MPIPLIGAGLIWVGSRVFVNVTEGAENAAGAGQKLAGTALLSLGAYLVYKKVVK